MGLFVLLIWAIACMQNMTETGDKNIMPTKKWTVAAALDTLKEASEAAAFLERKQQDLVNGNAVTIAEMVADKEDVDGHAFSISWKVKANTTKFGKACIKMVQVAEAHLAYEQKQKAIPADVIVAQKALPETVKA